VPVPTSQHLTDMHVSGFEWSRASSKISVCCFEFEFEWCFVSNGSGFNLMGILMEVVAMVVVVVVDGLSCFLLLKWETVTERE
jgi:hypothetical protein